MAGTSDDYVDRFEREAGLVGCRSCGRENRDDARFCRDCGAPISAPREKLDLTAPVPSIPSRPTPSRPILSRAEPTETALPFGAPPRDRRIVALVAVLAVALVAGAGIVVALIAANRDGDHVTAQPATSTTRVQPVVTKPPVKRTVPTVTTPPTRGPYATEDDAAVALLQRWADALAAKQWDAARAIEPDLMKSSDKELHDGYSGFHDARIVEVVSHGRTPNGYMLTVASIAHEVVSTGRRTSVWCYPFVTATRTTLNVTDGFVSEPRVAGWVGPARLADQIGKCYPEN